MLSFVLPFTATYAQASTYLVCVCLFSISFLVFLNATVSFVITDRIGQKTRVGDAVGTLGFADELVVLIACPIWGLLSDRIGLRAVAVGGYVIVGLALMVFVQPTRVYPDLLLARIFFALGAAATSTMVTAIMPAMKQKPTLLSSQQPYGIRSATPSSHNVTPSISSELTITPTRFHSRNEPAHSDQAEPETEGSTSQLAGLVGMCTGLGALVALGIFLPLPTRFQDGGVSPSNAVADSFYVVSAVALLVAILCFFGLRNLPGEEYKSWRHLFQFQPSKSLERHQDGVAEPSPLPSYPRMLLTSLNLGVRDVDIGLGYLGGFVARASSVAISLFIPLFVNNYFISSGLCPSDSDHTPQDPSEVKRNCQRAYIVASVLTGVSQVVALICAPLFGYLNAHYATHKIPLLLAAAAGVGGYVTFGLLKSPDPRSEDGGVGAYVVVALLGISQIGAIVCSLDLITRGIQSDDDVVLKDRQEQHDGMANRNSQGGNGVISPVLHQQPQSQNNDRVLQQQQHEHGPDGPTESTSLLPSHLHWTQASVSRTHLKGSIAGVYSLCGGVGILLLTKLGGLMFDRVDVGTPFFMMAGFNAVLLVATAACVSWRSLASTGEYEELRQDEERGDHDG